MIICWLVYTDRWNVCRFGSTDAEFFGSALLGALVVEISTIIYLGFA